MMHGSLSRVSNVVLLIFEVLALHQPMTIDNQRRRVTGTLFLYIGPPGRIRTSSMPTLTHAPRPTLVNLLIYWNRCRGLFCHNQRSFAIGRGGEPANPNPCLAHF